MEIKIGENIKRLRRERGVTQEQLSEVLNVSCAAISKWETGDTYPDITLLFPLSHYFKVSVDEIMGYDSNIIEYEIKDVIEQYQNYRSNFKYSEASELIKVARKKYPNDYQIMTRYLFEISGGLADNDPSVLNTNREEINKICDTILNGSTDEKIRLEAITIKAKLLHALGNTKEALELLSTFPSFYHSSGQRIEQLFAKDTDEFYNQLKFNMYELAEFTANKLAKSIFYDKTLNVDEKKNKVIKIGDTFKLYHNDNDFDIFILFASMFWGESRGKAVLLGFDNKFIIKCCSEVLEYVNNIETLKEENIILEKYLQESKVVSTTGNYLLNYINYIEKCLPAAILDDIDYIEIIKKYK